MPNKAQFLHQEKIIYDFLLTDSFFLLLESNWKLTLASLFLRACEIVINWKL